MCPPLYATLYVTHVCMERNIQFSCISSNTLRDVSVCICAMRRLTLEDAEYSYEFDCHESSKRVCQHIHSSHSQEQVEKPAVHVVYSFNISMTLPFLE